MDILKELTPILAVWGISLNLIFNGFRWTKETANRALGIVCLSYGFLMFAGGLVIYLTNSKNICCDLLYVVIFTIIGPVAYIVIRNKLNNPA